MNIFYPKKNFSNYFSQRLQHLNHLNNKTFFKISSQKSMRRNMAGGIHLSFFLLLLFQFNESSFASGREKETQLKVSRLPGIKGMPSTPEAAQIRTMVRTGKRLDESAKIVCKRLFDEPPSSLPVQPQASIASSQPPRFTTIEVRPVLPTSGPTQGEPRPITIEVRSVSLPTSALAQPQQAFGSQGHNVQGVEYLSDEAQEAELRRMLAVIETRRTQAQRAILGDLHDRITTTFNPAEMETKEQHRRFVTKIMEYLSSEDPVLKNLATEWSVRMFTFLQSWLTTQGWTSELDDYYLPYYDVGGRYAKIAKAILQEKLKLTSRRLMESKQAYETLKQGSELERHIQSKPALEILKRDPIKYLKSLLVQTNTLTEGHLVCLDLLEMQAVFYHLCHKIPFVKLNEDYATHFSLLSEVLQTKQQSGQDSQLHTPIPFSITGVPVIDGVDPEVALQALLVRVDFIQTASQCPVITLLCKNPEAIQYMKVGPDLDFLMRCFAVLPFTEFKAIRHHLFGGSYAIGVYAQEFERRVEQQGQDRLSGTNLTTGNFDIFEFYNAFKQFSNDRRFPDRIERCESVLLNLLETAQRERKEARSREMYDLCKEIHATLNTLKTNLNKGEEVAAWTDVEIRDDIFFNSKYAELKQTFETLERIIQSDTQFRRQMLSVIRLRPKLNELKSYVGV